MAINGLGLGITWTRGGTKKEVNGITWGGLFKKEGWVCKISDMCKVDDYPGLQGQ